MDDLTMSPVIGLPQFGQVVSFMFIPPFNSSIITESVSAFYICDCSTYFHIFYHQALVHICENIYS